MYALFCTHFREDNSDIISYNHININRCIVIYLYSNIREIIKYKFNLAVSPQRNTQSSLKYCDLKR